MEIDWLNDDGAVRQLCLAECKTLKFIILIELNEESLIERQKCNNERRVTLYIIHVAICPTTQSYTSTWGMLVIAVTLVRPSAGSKSVSTGLSWSGWAPHRDLFIDWHWPFAFIAASVGGECEGNGRTHDEWFRCCLVSCTFHEDAP